MDVLSRELEQLVGVICEDVILRDSDRNSVTLKGTFTKREPTKPFTFIYLSQREIYAVDGILTSDFSRNRNIDRPENIRVAQYTGGQILFHGSLETRRIDPKSREFLEYRKQLINAEVYPQHS